MSEQTRTWITDASGNRASIERWGSEDAARASLATLTRCSDCADCADCARCSGCSDCSGCADCADCARCADCYDCSRKKPDWAVPTVTDLHQRVYAAASVPGALNMGDWHTCETTHCRAGWIVTVAGEEGRALEAQTSTLFAAMQIAKASGHPVSPVRFFESNEKALADMKAMAECEKGQL